jgi:hypothetical protein
MGRRRFGRGTSAPAGDRPVHSPEALNDPDVVHAAVEEAKFHLEFEDARLQRDQQRAGWLLALDGVLLGLIANQARETLNDATLLGALGRDVAAGALAAAALFAVLSAVSALISLVRVRTWVWGRRSYAQLGRPEVLAQPRDHVEGMFLNGLLVRLQEEAEPTELDERDADWAASGRGIVGWWRGSLVLAMLRALREPISSSIRSRLLKTAFVWLTLALIAVGVHIGVWVERTVANPRCPLAQTMTVPASEAARFRAEPISGAGGASTFPVGESQYPTPGGCPGSKAPA